tara:strand:- start:816 stop:1679 length:864 start_codon:yes stop_codon:yes gene_type:complete
MPSLIELIRSENKIIYVLDVSPPRSGNGLLFQELLDLNPDVFSVAYNPGLSVRVNSAMMASWLQNSTGITTSFFLATRDMNKLALQSLLLGAQLHGLENIVVVQGDPFTASKSQLIRNVNDFTATELIQSVKNLNSRKDFEDKNLIYPTDFCVGATVDLSKELDSEVELLNKKILSGSDFLVLQPFFNVHLSEKLFDIFYKKFHRHIDIPIVWGIQMLEKDSKSFATIPDHILDDLSTGRPGIEITLQMIENLKSVQDIESIYLVPPFSENGRRNYEAAKELFTLIR